MGNWITDIVRACYLHGRLEIAHLQAMLDPGFPPSELAATQEARVAIDNFIRHHQSDGRNGLLKTPGLPELIAGVFLAPNPASGSPYRDIEKQLLIDHERWVREASLPSYRRLAAAALLNEAGMDHVATMWTPTVSEGPKALRRSRELARFTQVTARNFLRYSIADTSLLYQAAMLHPDVLGALVEAAIVFRQPQIALVLMNLDLTMYALTQKETNPILLFGLCMTGLFGNSDFQAAIDLKLTDEDSTWMHRGVISPDRNRTLALRVLERDVFESIAVQDDGAPLSISLLGNAHLMDNGEQDRLTVLVVSQILRQLNIDDFPDMGRALERDAEFMAHFLRLMARVNHPHQRELVHRLLSRPNDAALVQRGDDFFIDALFENEPHLGSAWIQDRLIRLAEAGSVRALNRLWQMSRAEILQGRTTLHDRLMTLDLRPCFNEFTRFLPPRRLEAAHFFATFLDVEPANASLREAVSERDENFLDTVYLSQRWRRVHTDYRETQERLERIHAFFLQNNIRWNVAGVPAEVLFYMDWIGHDTTAHASPSAAFFEEWITRWDEDYRSNPSTKSNARRVLVRFHLHQAGPLMTELGLPPNRHEPLAYMIAGLEPGFPYLSSIQALAEGFMNPAQTAQPPPPPAETPGVRGRERDRRPDIFSLLRFPFAPEDHRPGEQEGPRGR